MKGPPPGTSKIGGLPHLPAGFAWPHYEGEDCDGASANRPRSFLAQLDLAAMFSASGYRYFFYDVISMKWGFDPKDGGSARVFYFAVTADRLREPPFPDALAQEARVSLSCLSFKTMDELPAYEKFAEMTEAAVLRRALL